MLRPVRARATRIAKLDTWVNRVTGVPLDVRAAVGVYDPATGNALEVQSVSGHLRHVGVGEAVADRDGEYAVVALQRGGAIDEAAHQRQRGGIGADLPAIEQ